LNSNSSYQTLNYQLCDNVNNKDKMALIRIDFIGAGSTRVPPGSTIVSATLRLTALVGGDGVMWRAANPWNSSSTWNSFGGSSLNHFLSPSEGIGLNTEQGKEFDVTEEVQRWMNGEANQGWVLKGSTLDCAAARVYSNTSATKFPRLTVTYIADTTPPRVSNVFFASS
jgi:hypothetical protein